MEMKDFFGMPWFPINAAEHGDSIDDLIVYLHWVVLVFLVGWGIYYVVALIRFNSKRNPKADYKGITFPIVVTLAVSMTLVEIVLMFGYSIPIWDEWASGFPKEKDATVIRVVAEQFAWNFHYPGPDGKFGESSPALIDVEDNPLGINREEDENAKDDVVSQILHLPVDKPVIAHLSSKDVIHNFGIPVMRVKQDAIPGSVIPVGFTPIKTGKFLIACSQLCGIGHSTMQGYIEVKTEEEFNEWMEEAVEEALEAGDSF